MAVIACSKFHPSFPCPTLYNPINSKVMEEEKCSACQNDNVHYMTYRLSSVCDSFGRIRDVTFKINSLFAMFY